MANHSDVNSALDINVVSHAVIVLVLLLLGVGVAQLGGYLFAVGGHDGTNYLNSVEAYNPITDR